MKRQITILIILLALMLLYANWWLLIPILSGLIGIGYLLGVKQEMEEQFGSINRKRIYRKRISDNNKVMVFYGLHLLISLIIICYYIYNVLSPYIGIMR